MKKEYKVEKLKDRTYIQSGTERNLFQIEIGPEEVEISFDWDHGYDGSGYEFCTLPNERFLELIKEVVTK